MTKQELNNLLEDNTSVEWFDDIENEQLCFRNIHVEWYRNDENRKTAIKYWKIDEMSSDDLMQEINRGLLVEGITRITGYFTKTSSWNPGKRGELNDRKRFAVTN